MIQRYGRERLADLGHMAAAAKKTGTKRTWVPPIAWWDVFAA